MCLIALHLTPQHQLLLAANRDEFFARPTQALSQWQDDSGIVAGKDLKEGGTWLGINAKLELAALTNVRVQGVTPANPPSRGGLAYQFLQNHHSPIAQRLDALAQCAHRYAPFNLLAGNLTQLYYLTNYPSVQLQTVTAGVHALSNASLDTPWPKVQLAKQQMLAWLATPSDALSLSELLTSHHVASDEQLPNTGVPLPLERLLSAQHIHTPEYGTRAATGLILTPSSAQIAERSFNAQGQCVSRTQLLIHAS